MDQLFQEACYACFYRTRPLYLFSAKVMVFSELWTTWHIPHLEERKVNFPKNTQKVIKKIFLWLFWQSPNENGNAKWGDVGRLAKTALDVIREKQKEICNVWTKTIKRYISLKSFVLHQDETTNLSIPGKGHPDCSPYPVLLYSQDIGEEDTFREGNIVGESNQYFQ